MTIKSIKYILFFVFIVLVGQLAVAFRPDFYASNSALSEGKWVKIRVENTGMYAIPKNLLRSWGFSNPDKVLVFGYGGNRIDDLLDESVYIDDLPQTPSEITDAGIVFYGVGVDSWTYSADGCYHGELNPYSQYGHYFLTESDDPRLSPAPAHTPGASSPVTTAQARYHYEKERTQATIAGPLFVGEEFRSAAQQKFNIPTPGRVDGSPVWMECNFVHVSKTDAATLRFSVDNTTLPENAGDRVPVTAASSYVLASYTTTRHTFTPSSPQSFSLGLSYVTSAPSPQGYLDYLSFNYTRQLELPTEGYFSFWSEESRLALKASADTRIWDVTDPYNIAAVETDVVDNQLSWTTADDDMRAYVAWKPSASFPSPSFVETVANQNLHASIGAAHMVIITPSALLAQANRIADLHRTVDGMVVEVVDQEKIYNEYSSGTYDVGGIRKFLKNVYDKSISTDTPLGYVLLMGRTTLDHRGLANKHITDYKTTPWWVVREPRQSMSDNDGFGTDDFIAMLEDGSGLKLGLDFLSVAVGRIPALNATEADIIVDKLYQYVNNSKKTGWKNRMVVLADDEDQGVHLRQAESMTDLLSLTENSQHLIDKIYIDAYEKVGAEYPQARTEMFRLLDDGAAWWLFTGHANNHSWTGDGMLTFSDLNNLYLRHLPFLLASTCDFLRWDHDEISGGEILYTERNGGCISMISATRPVYITDNGYFLNAFGRQALSRDENGILVRSGEAYRRTKNDIRNNAGTIISNTNRLRFVFMGDPAMAITTPSNTIEITAIDGIEPGGDNQPTIAALSSPRIEGRVLTPLGEHASDFNGVVSVDIYDSDYSVTTLAHGDGAEDIYDRHGKKLFSGSATVTDGTFAFNAPMPSQIADNFRQATMSLYAYATNSNDEAVGLCRNFYVFGFEEPETPDITPPVIKSLVLNHSGFKSGDVVNPSPMLIAAIEDNIGINLSSAGVGQQMQITLDTFTTFDDVSAFYTPAADGSPSGVINYPLENLTEGQHSLTLRIFDTSGNSTAQTIDFKVSEKVMPGIFQVFTDANPASTSASFYVRHDRPDSYLNITITVYNLLGQPVWSGSAKGVSEMDISTPVVWDLSDNAGRRVQRGIYLYRASISTDNEHFQSASQKIAVTAP